MEPYGAEHFAALALTIALIVVLPRLVRRARDQRLVERWMSVAGWALLVITVLWTVWGMLPHNYDVLESLPLHFSDALRVITAVALIRRSGWAIAVSYFWGLTLNLQSMLTPDLTYAFGVPWLDSAMYWILHITVMVAPVVLVWGLGYRPTWFGYGTAFALAVGWAGLALVANGAIGANYGYLSYAPEGPTLLDVLGPWPIYILWEAVLVASVWALMTWPWTTARSIASAPIDDRLGIVRRKRLGAVRPLASVARNARGRRRTGVATQEAATPETATL